MSKIFSFIFIIFNFFSFSQEKNKRISIKEVSLSNGHNLYIYKNLDYNDFNKMAPESNLNDTAIYNFQNKTFHRNYGFYISYLYPSVSLSMGIYFYDKNNNRLKGNPVLRVGLTQVNYGYSVLYDDRIITPFDTLVSSTTGDQVLVTKEFIEIIRLEYRSKQLRLDMSLIYHLMEEKRINFYGGLGFNFGYSTSNQTHIEKSNFEHIYPSIYNEEHFSLNNNNTLNNRYQSKSNQGGSIYLPIGINLKLGLHKKFWSKINIYSEIRPAINFFKIPELSNTFEFSTYHLIQTGLKIRW